MKTRFYFTQQIGKNKNIKVLNTKGQQNTSKKSSYKLKKKEVPISSKEHMLHVIGYFNRLVHQSSYYTVIIVHCLVKQLLVPLLSIL